MMPMPGIVWLLDLDGVLNFFGRSAWPSVRGLTVDFGGTGYRIRYSPEMIAAITEVAQDCQIDVRLCSTWCEQPGPILAQLGLSIPVAFTPRSGDNIDRLKLAAALDVVASGARLIWADDVAIPSAGAGVETLRDSGALLIAPNEMGGLTPAQLTRIREWATDGGKPG